MLTNFIIYRSASRRSLPLRSLRSEIYHSLPSKSLVLILVCRAKKTATDNGGKIVKEFALVKGFVYEHLPHCQAYYLLHNQLIIESIVFNTTMSKSPPSSPLTTSTSRKTAKSRSSKQRLLERELVRPYDYFVGA